MGDSNVTELREVCGDDRFDLIAKARETLIDRTNIEMRQDEMNVLDSILFRCWQMGWLDQLRDTPEQARNVSMNDSQVLSSCPFCGGEAEVMHLDLDSIKKGWKVYGVRCISDANAGLRGETQHGHFIDNFATEAEAIEAWNARADYHGYEQAAIEAWENVKKFNEQAVAATLGSEPDETELTQIYDAGFSNGVMAVFQQLEGVEDYEELQDLIAEYWAEGEGYDER